jgi:hypothetical protein
MNRDEILEKSRAENKIRDEREQQLDARAARYALSNGVLVCSLLLLIQLILVDRSNPGVFAVWLSMSGTHTYTKYTQLQNKKRRIIGIVELVGAVLCFIAQILLLVEERYGF